MSLALSLLALLLPTPAQAATYEALLFDVSSKEGKPVFRLHYEDVRSTDGHLVGSTTRHLGLDGTEVVSEKVAFSQGRLGSYQLFQHQTGTEVWVDVEKDRLRIRRTHEGKTSSSEEVVKGDVVVGPTLLPYLEARLGKVLAGEGITFQYVVVDRLLCVKMEAVLRQRRSEGDVETLVVEVSPKNRFVGLVAPPVEITVERRGGKLRIASLLAPAAPLLVRGSRRVEFLARMEFVEQ